MRKAINAIANVLDVWVAYICATFLGLMTLLVLTGVLFRYVFQSPIGWTEEISRYLMIWAASLAISIGIRENEHIGITVLVDSIRNRVIKGILVTLIDLFVLGFIAVMIWYSIPMLQESQYQFAQSFRASMFWPSLSIPVAMGLAGLQVVFKISSTAFGDVEGITSHSNIDI